MFLMYSNTVFKQPLEVECIHVTLVSRIKENMLKKRLDVQVKSSLKIIIMSGLPYKIWHQSTAILKTFGDFSLVCSLQFVEQQFN